MRFSEMSSPEIGEAAKGNALVLLPVGQTEEHGPHLPAGTDAMISDELASRIEKALDAEIPVVVMDTVRYGYSVKKVANWPGTIRLSHETVTNLLREVCGSLAEMGFRKIAIINSHGNHPGLLEMVSRRVGDEHGVDVPVLDVGGLVADAIKRYAEGGEGACCHACEMETSIMLRVRPDLVRTDLCPTGERVRVKSPVSGGVFWSTWWRQKSRTGVYGEPKAASADKGEKFIQAIVEKACVFLRAYYAHPGPQVA